MTESESRSTEVVLKMLYEKEYQIRALNKKLAAMEETIQKIANMVSAMSVWEAGVYELLKKHKVVPLAKQIEDATKDVRACEKVIRPRPEDPRRGDGK